FADVIDRVGENMTLSRLKELGAKNLAPDVLTFLLYVVNESTKDYVPKSARPATGQPWIFKRYDIIDLGGIAIMSPGLAANAIAAGRLFGEAYEIKSDKAGTDDQKAIGRNYIKTQIGKFADAMSAFGPDVADALKIAGLEKYEMRAGKSWPTGT